MKTLLNRIFAVCFTLVAFCISCSSTTSKEEKTEQGGSWTVTLKGKVVSPQTGQQIVIQEMKNGGNGWKDTIMLRRITRTPRR